ncbi:hypothetical protein, conserved [Angomonas deanei]|uniref:Uncharacterized protein n=1 Tax=Angomonas deanei TaxID=59799 RepID=A0A7G2CD81_9TRYP|nr:hypothetical protein, conserved [Angomonas deanei]
MEEKARRAEETGEWSSSTTQTSHESIPRSVPIAKFLTSHKYMSPGTNYIKLSAVREVVLKLSNAKSKANQKREEEEGPPAKATRPPPAATNVKGYMGKIRPRLPVSIDPMAPKSTAFQPLDGSANLPPPPPSPPKSSTPRATRGKTISHPSKGGKSA